MSTDTLTEAVANLESAWRRLREVLDGPDVAAALVEASKPRPMATAPRDGTWARVHIKSGQILVRKWVSSVNHWSDGCGHGISEDAAIGWSPVK